MLSMTLYTSIQSDWTVYFKTCAQKLAYNVLVKDPKTRFLCVLIQNFDSKTKKITQEENPESQYVEK